MRNYRLVIDQVILLVSRFLGLKRRCLFVVRTNAFEVAFPVMMDFR